MRVLLLTAVFLALVHTGGAVPAERTPFEIRATHAEYQAAAVYARRYRIRVPLAVAIRRAALSQRIPVPQAFRLVKTESGFDSLAVNATSGACGLTQLLPSTIRSWRPGLDVRRVCTETALNLSVGLSYYRMLYRRYGDWQLATSAYYLGHGTVDTLSLATLDTLTYTRKVLDE